MEDMNFWMTFVTIKIANLGPSRSWHMFAFMLGFAIDVILEDVSRAWGSHERTGITMDSNSMVSNLKTLVSVS